VLEKEVEVPLSENTPVVVYCHLLYFMLFLCVRVCVGVCACVYVCLCVCVCFVSEREREKRTT